MSQMVIAAALLGFTLVVFTLGKSPFLRVDRAGAAIIAAAVTVGAGVLSFDEAARSVDYRTIVLLFSMMIVAAYLKLSGFFQVLGNLFLSKVQTKKQLLLAVILTSGLLSAFFINDVICLLFTPVVLMLCKKTELNAVPYLLGIATASNIGSAGTLIGNPQNILIGSISKIPFSEYLLAAFPMAILGLIVNYYFIAWLYREELQGELPQSQPLNGAYHGYLITKSLAVTVGILIGFLAGLDPVVITGLGSAYLLMTRRLKPAKVYSCIDFNLLVIFVGLFVVIGGVEQSGLMKWFMQSFNAEDVSNFSFFAGLTVVLSNIFSNVPAVLLLKFFIPAHSGNVWWIGLGVFSTLAGNLTLTGSIANLIVVEVAKREGVEVTFFDYLKVGLPLTIVLTILALLYFNIFYL